MIEFNDQGNAVPVEALQRVLLAGDHVRFIFHRGAGPFAGRVSLAEDIEVFGDVLPDPSADGPFSCSRFDEVQLTAICIRFDVDDARLDALRQELGVLL
jgi:hypothetical protein